MKTHVLGIVLGVLFGLPAVAFGSSFTYSLIQGKTPAEAVSIIATQVDVLFGRVDTLESQQASTTLEIQRLQLENENLRLKADAIASSTDKIRATESRSTTCADFASKIGKMETTIKAPFVQQITVLNTQYHTLYAQKNSATTTMDEAAAIKQQMQAIQKQMSDLNDKAQQAMDANADLQSLIKQANDLLCA